MIKFPIFLGPIHTLNRDYKYMIAGQVVDVVQAGTKIYFEGRNPTTGMYLYSC